MSHSIGYLEFSKRTSPKKILQKLDGFAYDPQESCGYHGNLTFYSEPVYKSREEAEEAIKRLDTGWYSDHAVVYREHRRLYWLVKYEYHC